MIPKESRTKKDYEDLGRFLLSNHMRRAITDAKQKGTEPAERKPKFTLADFVGKEFWKWIMTYLKNRFGRNHKYTDYEGSETGIYNVNRPGEETIIALAADWATNTKESIAVADKMREQDPHFTIHLGDTYYVGDAPEIAANFLPVGNSLWPRGRAGSFALLGNHEMYARGIAFFDNLLPSLGLSDSNNNFSKQGAGFFCLENDHWRILGLDTGYHSIGKVPLIEIIPLFGPDCHFDKILINWLKNVVKLGDPGDKRSIVILTHHQYVSAFEKAYPKPGEQLADLIGKDRPVIWLFGHEHKFAMYEKAQVRNGITAYSRCMGHGGMPVEVVNKDLKLNNHFIKKDKFFGFDKLVLTDARVRPDGGELQGIGYNGYSVIRLKDEKLIIEYNDTESKLVSEIWSAMTDGTMKGSIAADEPGLKIESGKNLEDAVR